MVLIVTFLVTSFHPIWDSIALKTNMLRAS